MKPTLYVALALATIFALSPKAGPAGVPHHYSIRFAAEVDGRSFECGATYNDLGTTRAAITPEFLRLYVSDVRLIESNGGELPLTLDQDGVWQQRDVAFLSFEGAHAECASGSPQERRVVSGTAPSGNVVGVRFTVGVPQSLDHGDATIASSPLNLSDMFWSWQDGYKFFRFDGRVSGKAGTTRAFVFHLGSTGCTQRADSTRCAHPNEASIRLRFNPSQTIVLDVGKLLAGVDLERGQGCMMMAGEACAPELRSLGVSGSEQTVFAVR
jgi:uncharacterized repeat protein (TIGR04052 family)